MEGFNLDDYILEIEFERLSVSTLSNILDILYLCSSECYVDIEQLADEVIRRQMICGYSIKDPENGDFIKLIHKIFDVLKKISKYMIEPSTRIKQIYNLFHKYMHNIDSPVMSPVISPKKKTKIPKIMKKVKNLRKD